MNGCFDSLLFVIKGLLCGYRETTSDNASERFDDVEEFGYTTA